MNFKPVRTCMLTWALNHTPECHESQDDRKVLKKRVQYHRFTVKIFPDKKIYNECSVESLEWTVHCRVNNWCQMYQSSPVMALGAVAFTEEKMPPYFQKLGEKLGADIHCKILRYHVLRWLRSNYPEGKCMWTWDVASSQEGAQVLHS